MRQTLWMTGIALMAAGCGSSHSGGGGSDGGASADAGADAGALTCPAGESYFWPGCGSGEEVTITAGCYRPCEDAFDGSCPAGTLCRRTDVNPCVCPDSEGCCAACGAEQWLCLEPPDTEPYELGSLDDGCEGLLTGRDLLDAIDESYTATLEYHDATPSTELTLTFTYDGGRLVCHPAIPAPPGSGAPDRPAFLEVEVGASIVTADGAFDEVTTTMLSARTASWVELAVRLAAGELSGSYEPQLTDVTEHTVTFGGQLSGATTSGNAVEAGLHPGGVGETAGIGSWSSSG